MPTHNLGDPEPDNREPGKVDTSLGYEKSDVRVSGIVVFLTALGIFVVVSAMLCYGIGKVINAHLNKEDGPRTRWAKSVDIRQLGNMPNSPEMQNRVATLTEQFPTPRLQIDDGNQEVADLHAKEWLLLENYSWVNESQGKVRIPIERAMELIAQRGLPEAPKVGQQPLMTGDSNPVVAVPLTNGFARTAYEQEQAQARGAETRKP